jgi:hypothetical protein
LRNAKCKINFANKQNLWFILIFLCFEGDQNESYISYSISEYEQIINGVQGYILWGVVFVLVAFFGCICNIITIIVLRRDPIMSTLTTLLIALAISDMLAPQANALLAFCHYHLSHKYGNSVNYLKMTDFLRHIIQPLSSMFTMSSSWIVTTTTLFRLIAVMWPFKARTLINKKCAIFALMLIFGFSLISIVPIYSGLIIRQKCTRDNKGQYMAFDLQMSEFLRKTYVPTLNVTCFYLPWLTSLTLWIFLIRSLRKSEKNFNISFVAKEFSITGAYGTASGINASNYLNLDKSLLNRESYESSSQRNNSILADANNKLVQNSTGNIFSNNDSRVNNAQTRMRSYNKITLMVVVLCFTNLICQIFTFVFIFEAIYNEYMSHLPRTQGPESPTLDSKSRFPKFLAYSLLLNNIFLSISHSCNIFIYTFTNPRFKRNLISLFRRNIIRKLFFNNRRHKSNRCREEEKSNLNCSTTINNNNIEPMLTSANNNINNISPNEASRSSPFSLFSFCNVKKSFSQELRSKNQSSSSIKGSTQPNSNKLRF